MFSWFFSPKFLLIEAGFQVGMFENFSCQINFTGRERDILNPVSQFCAGGYAEKLRNYF